jgi:hypothetical protein
MEDCGMDTCAEKRNGKRGAEKTLVVEKAAGTVTP